MTTRKKYRLSKLRLEEISIVDVPADPNAVVTIFKRTQPGTQPVQPGADDKLSSAEADRVFQELRDTIAKARNLVGQIPDDADPRRLRGVEDSIRKLAAAQASAAITLRQFQARQQAEAVFKATGLTSMADLRAEVAKAEALPAKLKLHRDQADLAVLREARAKVDRPVHPVDRDRRRINDALDDEVRARQASTGEDYLTAMDAILAERKRTRGG